MKIPNSLREGNRQGSGIGGRKAAKSEENPQIIQMTQINFSRKDAKAQRWKLKDESSKGGGEGIKTDAGMNSLTGMDDSLREGWIPSESGMTPCRRDEFLRVG